MVNRGPSIEVDEVLVKDFGKSVEVQVIYETSVFRVRKIRMKKSDKLSGLGGPSRENVVVALDGEVQVTDNLLPQPTKLSKKDVCYLPAYDPFEINKLSEEALVIIAEASTDKRLSPYVKRFKEMPRIKSGYSTYQRWIYVAIGEREQTDHFLAGYTEGFKGNWTSFPPHKHDDKAEVYLYYGMGDGYALQMLATNEKEEIYRVVDGDALIIERGYHQNVAIPTCGINYLWVIYAQSDNRNLDVEVHPKFRSVPFGQTHMRAK